MITGPYMRLKNAPLRGPGEHCLAPIDMALDMGSAVGRLRKLDVESKGDRVR